MFCEKCGAKLPEGSKFCESCGNAIPSPVAEEAIPPSAETPVEATPDKEPLRFCENCGAKLPEGSKFCESCGQEVGAAIAAAAAPAAPSAASIAIKKFFSNKRNVAIIAGALALLLAVIIIIVVIASLPPKPKTIYLDDYFTIRYEGADGYAYAEIQWDHAKLNELNNQIFSLEDFDSYDEFLESTDGKYTYYDISDYLELSLSKSESLSNGDSVNLLLSYTRFEYTDSFTPDPIDASDFKEDLNVILKLRNESVTVSELTPVIAFDPFEHVVVNYVGTDGYGEMEIVVPEDAVFTSLSSKSFRFNAYSGGFEVVLYVDGEYTFGVSYYCENTRDLSNGDTVTFEVSSYFDPSSQQQLASYGFSLAKLSTTKTVSGLAPILEYNPADNLAPIFSGYDTLGTFENGFKEEQVTAGRYTLVFSDDSNSYRRRIHIAIVDENGDTLSSFTYTADTYYDLSNGDTVTFETYEYLDSMKENYGILFPETFTVTVADLEIPIHPGILDNATIAFDGINGYGTMLFQKPSDDKQVYIIGDYTFKLDFPAPTTSWGTTIYKVTVVVAKDGENILSVYYECYASDHLENGDTIDFDCSIYQSQIEEYLTTYGILFPEEYTFTVEGLKEPIATDPRDYLSYNFSGTSGSIILQFSLKESSYTVGDYTVSLSTSFQDDGWGYAFAFLHYTVTDKNGNNVGSGSYRTDASNLSEGDTIYINPYDTDFDALVANCGILFNTDSKTTIVSAK